MDRPFSVKAAEARFKYLENARLLGWDAADRVITNGSAVAAESLAKLRRIVRDDWDRSYVLGFQQRMRGEARTA